MKNVIIKTILKGKLVGDQTYLTVRTASTVAAPAPAADPAADPAPATAAAPVVGMIIDTVESNILKQLKIMHAEILEQQKIVRNIYCTFLFKRCRTRTCSSFNILMNRNENDSHH